MQYAPHSAESMNMRKRQSYICHWPRICVLVVILPVIFGFGSPLSRLTKQGNEAFNQKRYDEALENYKNAQVESPEAPELHFNIGNVLFRQKKYDKSIEEFQKLPGSTNEGITESKAYYNIGVAQYRIAEQHESLGNISEALKSLEDCMESNRIAMRKNPDDPDPKFNFEQAKRKWKELYAKYKEQQAQQEQQQPQAKQEQQAESEEQKQDQAQQEQQQEQESQQQEQAQEAEEQEDQSASQAQAEQEEQKTGEMTKADAMRLLNSLAEEDQQQYRQLFNQHFRGALDMENDW